MNLLILKFILFGSVLIRDDFFLYQQSAVYENRYLIGRDNAEGTIGFDATLIFMDNWFIGGKCETFISPVNFSFAVERLNSLFKIGYQNDWLEVGYRHGCYHPLYNYARAGLGLLRNADFEGAFDEVYFTISGKCILIE
jgi:hypothetical protein